MAKKNSEPKFVFESSWEVCNKVGGIYTVLSTRAKTLQEQMPGRVHFIGPDFWAGKKNPLFRETKTLLSGWREYASKEYGLSVRVGRWQIPGEPVAILVDFKPFFDSRDEIFKWAWDNYKVNSLNAYGDYDECMMFSWAAGKVVESFFKYHNLSVKDNVIFQAHEWQTCLAALYINKYVPEVATIFTTHATTIGRSIAGNSKPLYDHLSNYNGDQMADELNVQAKHSVEKQAAWNVDCFTTVSDITAKECEALLDKSVDEVLVNGFEDDFVPSPVPTFNTLRRRARASMLRVASTLLGTKLAEDTLIVSIGGRYEYSNKGINVFVDAVNRLRYNQELDREVLAFVMVPAWIKGPRQDLIDAMKVGSRNKEVHGDPRVTHELYEPENDKVLGQLNWLNFYNSPSDKVKLVFVPCYLDGNDGIFNLNYYELLIGVDITVFPSYYEPWGYTPLESVAFHVPCVTTDLAGFGIWANEVKGGASQIEDGVKTIHRSDYNFNEVSDSIVDTLLKFSKMEKKQVTQVRRNAAKIAEKALWRHFIKYYYRAYDKALGKRNMRLKR